MARAKGSASSNRRCDDENEPVNGKSEDFSRTSEDSAVGLLLHLSRNSRESDKTIRKSTQSQSSGGEQALSGEDSTTRRKAHLPGSGERPLYHESDDQGGFEHNISSNSVYAQPSDSVHRTESFPLVQSATESRSHMDNRVAGDMPPLAMALSPPPRLPKVEFGSIIKDMHHTCREAP